MALANEQHAPDPIFSHGVKSVLEGSGIGRIVLHMGRKIRRLLQKLGDPMQHKAWIRQFGLPVRNAILVNRQITVSLAGIPVFLTPRGSAASDIWAGLRCETHEISFILNILQPGMVFFDVGANAGLFAISAAKRIGGKNVFAFEPCSSTVDLLKRNVLLNRVVDVNVVRTALGASVGEGVLQVNSRGRDGLNTLGQATHPDSKVVGREDVPITTVDTFVSDRNIPRIDVMNVDIEGGELMLFRGARELLTRPDAPVILYEGFGFLTRGFGYHPVEILWFLESCGYTLFLLNSQTGQISELKPDYQYDAMVIAAKPGHSAYSSLRERSGADSAGSGLPLQPGQSWSPLGNC